jgi:uncharacterized membrane protein YedE/YeeE
MEATMRSGVTQLIIAAVVATVTAGAQLPSRWRSKHRPCAGNPSRTAMSPRFRRLTFTSVNINNLEATFSVDRATE